MRRLMRGVIYFLMGFGIVACSTTSLNLREGIASFKQQNYRSAFVRLMPEAEKGHPDAQYAIGYMYYYGEGVTEDKAKAAKWIYRAAELGQKDAIAAAKLLSL